ncbi:MoaD/ThiS family protein [Zhongshania aquimaris]|uniref:MoaD/ThiS family protein n=1 Tax=Zhongshania aquimaris TaxID=2857107 RepID=A0ABS6VTE8_9GAMM|nr:MoaD/ThiS family protein [Zhongshania aquimaris]MBW2941582.1 MoaD/ThiS family protein [Zhongshania aquimaris]
MTRHLFRFFPQLQDQKITVPGGSVANVIHAVESMAPGFSHYILDERGALRRHVNLSINDSIVIDRKTLSDRVPEDGTLFIFQALSGG